MLCLSHPNLAELCSCSAIESCLVQNKIDRFPVIMEFLIWGLHSWSNINSLGHIKSHFSEKSH